MRHFSNELTGLFVTVDGVGTLVGTVIWGIVADRDGRKANLLGFVLATAAIGALPTAPSIVPLLLAIEFAYAAGLSCTNCWAAGASWSDASPRRDSSSSHDERGRKRSSPIDIGNLYLQLGVRMSDG